MRLEGKHDEKRGAIYLQRLWQPPPSSRSKVVIMERPAPIAILSVTKRTAVIECFENSGLEKRNGYWGGPLEGRHISGVTVADLARDGLFSVITNRPHASARLTALGQYFARTLIEAAAETQRRESLLPQGADQELAEHPKQSETTK
jgi:hypothetical protein